MKALLFAALATFVIILATAHAVFGQCIGAPAPPGTNCAGPLMIQPQAGNAEQSAIIMLDLSLPVPSPAVRQYILSIQNGTLVESENGAPYHSLVGPPGAQGPIGPQGATGPQGPPGPSGSMPSNVLTRGSSVKVGCAGLKKPLPAICNTTITLQ